MSKITSTAGFLMLLGCWVVISGCATAKENKLSTSQCRFRLGDSVYRIMSISSNEPGEYGNKLIGEDFVAVDFDRDRIIDRILLGEVTLDYAQEVYNRGLQVLAEKNKLVETPIAVSRYIQEKRGYYHEIKSFQPAETMAFNEFAIFEKGPLKTTPSVIVVDQQADGTLDQILKGAMALKDAQTLYAEAIQAGLANKLLVKVDSMILVKN